MCLILSNISSQILLHLKKSLKKLKSINKNLFHLNCASHSQIPQVKFITLWEKSKKTQIIQIRSSSFQMYLTLSNTSSQLFYTSKEVLRYTNQSNKILFTANVHILLNTSREILRHSNHSNHSNKIFSTSHVPYTFKYLRLDLLILKRGFKTLETFK